MKHLIFTTILLVLTGAPALADDTSAALNDTLAFLSVSSPVPGLEVFLDEQEIGVTPLDSMFISTGAHELAVVSPYGASWNHPPFKRSFVAAPGKKYSYTADFNKNVVLNTQPYGSRVYSDSLLLGTTPLVLNSELESVVVYHQGYDSLKVALLPVQSPGILVKLLPNKQWVREKKAAERQKKRSIKRRRGLMLTSLGVAVASGIATAHFHARGNDAYAQYQSTAVPENMETYYERAEEYDLYAGICYAVFEVSFVLTGYLFLASRF